MARLRALLMVVFISAIAPNQILVNAKFSKSMYFASGANNQSTTLGNGDNLQLVLDKTAGKIIFLSSVSYAIWHLNVNFICLIFCCEKKYIALDASNYIYNKYRHNAYHEHKHKILHVMPNYQITPLVTKSKGIKLVHSSLTIIKT